MVKTETEIQFDNLVSKVIYPHFKAIGYKKTGSNFRYYDNDNGFGKIVSFQKSRFYSKDHINFAVNVGLYLNDFEFYLTGKKSAEKFTEVVCAVRYRTGKLMGDLDTWYDLNADTNIAELQKRLEQHFLNYIIPYLDKIKTRDDIINELILESTYGYPVIARIKTLYHNGQREKALNILKSEYRGATEVMKKWLDNLNLELTKMPNA